MPRLKFAIFFRNLIIFAVVAAAFFGVGFWTGKNSVVCKVCAPEAVDFSLFWETRDILLEKFVNPENFSEAKMIYGAISGMVQALGDEYTVFFNPEDKNRFLEDVSGRFEGVGMEIGKREGELQVISPIENTPAQKAGMRPGDKILKIDDRATLDMAVDEAVSLIRGPKGTTVILTIFRDGWEAPKEIKIQRGVIEIPSLKWEMKGDIAYIKIYHFSDQVDADFSRVAAEIKKSSASKIILDVRNNPGGYLEVAVDIAGWFLDRGDIVVIEDFGGKQEQKIYRAQGPSGLAGYPAVILINKGSASASEILAAALGDNRDIKMVGETSFGKGSVQELEELSDGSGLKITVAKWLTPQGELISETGLKPGVEILMTDDDYEQRKDPQLEKAIELLSEMR